MAGESYYNVTQAAQALNLSEHATRRLFNTGDLFAIKVSNKWYISPDSIAMYKRTKAWRASQNKRAALLARGGISKYA